MTDGVVLVHGPTNQGNGAIDYDGTFNVNAADDAVHSNNAITISGGALTLATGDDAIHADAAITIDAVCLLYTSRCV